MIKNLIPEELIAFETDIAECFNNKQIKAPIHLEYDNEKQLINVFQDVNEEDWICTTWRSHYKHLLKGVPKEELKQAILNCRSIALCFKDHRTISSAIVGGNLSIGLGLALDIKRKQEKNKVWVFLGEMTSITGQFFECYEYAKSHELPITFVIEDNGKSVKTDTRQVWNKDRLYFEPITFNMLPEKSVFKSTYLYYYKYRLDKKWQHAGTNVRVMF